MSSGLYAAKNYANKVTRQRDALARALRELLDASKAHTGVGDSLARVIAAEVKAEEALQEHAR